MDERAAADLRIRVADTGVKDNAPLTVVESVIKANQRQKKLAAQKVAARYPDGAVLAVLGICVAPFLNLGAHYLLYKGTAALAATAAGSGRLTGLIEALGTAFGLILAMTASCAVLLTVAMVSAVSAVG